MTTKALLLVKLKAQKIIISAVCDTLQLLSIFPSRFMDASLKELSKLEKLQVYSLNADSSDNTKSSSSISDTLESLLDALQRLKQRVQTECSPEVLAESYSLIESKKKEIDEKQKEVHTSLGRLGKTIDKVWLLFHCARQHWAHIRILEVHRSFTNFTRIIFIR